MKTVTRHSLDKRTSTDGPHACARPLKFPAFCRLQQDAGLKFIQYNKESFILWERRINHYYSENEHHLENETRIYSRFMHSFALDTVRDNTDDTDRDIMSEQPMSLLYIKRNHIGLVQDIKSKIIFISQ